MKRSRRMLGNAPICLISRLRRPPVKLTLFFLWLPLTETQPHDVWLPRTSGHRIRPASLARTPLVHPRLQPHFSECLNASSQNTRQVRAVISRAKVNTTSCLTVLKQQSLAVKRSRRMLGNAPICLITRLRRPQADGDISYFLFSMQLSPVRRARLRSQTLALAPSTCTNADLTSHQVSHVRPQHKENKRQARTSTFAFLNNKGVG